MPLLAPNTLAAPKTVEDASRAMESLLVKQMLSASGAFHKSGLAGSSVTAGLFIDTLADAISSTGQLGIAAGLTRQLSGQVSAAPNVPPTLAGTLSAALPSATASLAGLTASPNHVTSGFGVRSDPFDGHLASHQGIDLAAPAGTPILAAADGVVVSAGERGGYGNAVEIQHGPGVTSLYAHAESLSVKPGDHVARGQEIGTVGQTGKATGPHLHFEVRVSAHPVDPRRAIGAYGALPSR